MTTETKKKNVAIHATPNNKHFPQTNQPSNQETKMTDPWSTHLSCQFFFFFNVVAILENHLTVQWLGLGSFTAVAQIQSLARELRPQKPCGTAKKKL